MSSPLSLPNEVTRLLLVEGESDKDFFRRLSDSLPISPLQKPYIVTCEGVNNLGSMLKALLNLPNAKRFTHIGIVRDADFDNNAFQKVVDMLGRINKEREEQGLYMLPIPQTPEVFDGNALKMGVFIMPDSTTQGMLETLVWRVLQSDPLARCVESYFACLAEAGVQAKPQRVNKTAVRLYLRTHALALLDGKNTDEAVLSRDADKTHFTNIFQMAWWSWDAPELEQIRNFIGNLTA